MAVSKRLRYEVLRRDGFTCRYCGRGAPLVELRVDHVIPSSLDGPDTIDNLVAACHDCNAGKGSILIDVEAQTAATTGNKLWRDAVALAASEANVDLPEVEAACARLLERWQNWSYEERGEKHRVPMGDDWRSSVKNWILRGCPVEIVLDSVPIVMKREKVVVDEKWRYFCGIVWNKLRALEERAAEIVAEAVPYGMDDHLREAAEDEAM